MTPYDMLDNASEIVCQVTLSYDKLDMLYYIACWVMTV